MVSFGPCVSPPPLPGQGVFEIRSRSQGVVYVNRVSCVWSRGQFLLPNARFPTLREGGVTWSCFTWLLTPKAQ